MALERIEPGPGQESVWDYPRPPRVEETDRHVRVIFNGEVVADSRHAKRVLETSHPPVYYIPREHVRPGCLEPTDRETFCEWKGRAVYFRVVIGDGLVQAQVSPAAGVERVEVKLDQFNASVGQLPLGRGIESRVVMHDETWLEGHETARQPPLLGVRYGQNLHPLGAHVLLEFDGLGFVDGVPSDGDERGQVGQRQGVVYAIVNRVRMHDLRALGILT